MGWVCFRRAIEPLGLAEDMEGTKNPYFRGLTPATIFLHGAL